MGCVYTAQGFEFDYVGVIFGTELGYDGNRKIWHDSVVKKAPEEEFVNLVKLAELESEISPEARFLTARPSAWITVAVETTMDRTGLGNGSPSTRA